MNRRPTPAPRRTSADLRSRTGLALPVAIFALVVIGLFVAGSAFVVLEEGRASLGTFFERAALEAAEYGATAVLRDWDRDWNTQMQVGATAGPFVHLLAGGARATARATRITTTTWWVVSEGTAGGLLARQQARRLVNAVFRLDVPLSPIGAAIRVADSLHVTGTGRVAGADTSLASGCAAGAGAAGVASPDTTRTCDGTCGAVSVRISGAPPLLGDSSAAAPWRSSPYWASRADSADITLPGGTIITPSPVVSVGVCDRTVSGNWGDPGGGACAAWLPVIHVLGDVTVKGGTGQGIVLADGDIVVESGAAFSGILMAGDDLVTGAGGATVIGSVVAADSRRAGSDHSVVGDAASVRWSTCAIRSALLGGARPVRVRDRWWAEFD